MNKCIAEGYRSDEGKIIPFALVIDRNGNDLPSFDEATEKVKQVFVEDDINHGAILVIKVK